MDDVAVMPNIEVRNRISKFEDILKRHPAAMSGDCFPLSHNFADGLYVREIRVPKGSIVVTKIFKQNHATFLLQGECSVVTEEGIKRIKAPFSMITRRGTRRVVFCHEDVVWTTVHANPTDTKDLTQIESFVIAKDYKELDFSEDEKKVMQMMEAQSCHG